MKREMMQPGPWAAVVAVAVLAGCAAPSAPMTLHEDHTTLGFPYVTAEGEIRRDDKVFGALAPVANSLRWEAIDGPTPDRPAVRFTIGQPYQGAGRLSISYIGLQGSFTADTGLTSDWIGPEVPPAERAAFSTEVRVRSIVKLGPFDSGAHHPRRFRITLAPDGKPSLAEISLEGGGAFPDGPSALAAIQEAVTFKMLPPAPGSDLERVEFAIVDKSRDPRTYVHHWLRTAGTLSDKDGLTTIWTPPVVEKGREGAFDAFVRLQLETWDGGLENAYPLDFVVMVTADRKLQVQRLYDMVREDQR